MTPMSRFEDALSLLGLADNSADELDETERKILADLVTIESGHRAESRRPKAVYKSESEDREQFELGPAAAVKGLTGPRRESFYCGPLTADMMVSPWRTRYGTRAIARATMRLPDVMTREGNAVRRGAHWRGYSPSEVCRPWLR